MNVATYTNREIVLSIKNGGKDLEIIFKHLLQDEKKSNAIRNLVYRIGGNKEDYEEILDDTLVALHSSVINGSYKETYPVIAYMKGIAKNLCYQTWSKKKIKPVTNEIPNENNIPSIEAKIIKKERSQLLLKLISRLGERCKNILIKAFIEGLKNQELAESLNYKNEAVVRKTKSQCLRKLLNLLDKHPELLKELAL